MSTIFGILKKGEPIELINGSLPENHNSEFSPVAKRMNNHAVWHNDLAEFLSDETRVYPMNNSAQGIFTIGDLKKLI